MELEAKESHKASVVSSAEVPAAVVSPAEVPASVVSPDAGVGPINDEPAK